MGDTYSRRAFLPRSGADALSSAGPAGQAASESGDDRSTDEETVRLGFVGVGDRGSWHLGVALGMPGVKVPALCDINKHYLYRAKRWVEEAGQPTPRLYDRGDTTVGKRTSSATTRRKSSTRSSARPSGSGA